MSVWDRGASKCGPRAGALGEVSIVEDRLVFHTLVRAKALPNEPGQWGRSDMSACEKCTAVVRRVVFTTAGEGEQQIALWREYPLAVDGWLCAQCGWAAVPRRMSAREVTDCIQTGVQHAQKGVLNDAEYWFRRAACSWPDYSPGLANLAELLISRAAAPGRDVSERHALREAAERYFRRALEKDPTNLAANQVVSLARLEAWAGREDEALGRLEALERGDHLSANVRRDVDALRAQIKQGRALFSRASELAGNLILVHGRAPSPLSKIEREHLLKASRLLEDASARNPTAFANWWMLGKVRQRLGEHRAALEALRLSLKCDASQIDGCREYVAVCLELGEGTEAVRVARHACELRPGDAGLQSNLAVAQLIAGQIDDAVRTVEAAVKADPVDKITRALEARIAAVREGRRPVPRTLAELEGRRR
jgi:tetratricopeptide (TPR) repeat protein